MVNRTGSFQPVRPTLDDWFAVVRQVWPRPAGRPYILRFRRPAKPPPDGKGRVVLDR